MDFAVPGMKAEDALDTRPCKKRPPVGIAVHF